MPKDMDFANNPLAQVRSLAAVAYTEAEGDYSRAAEQLKTRLRADEGLFNAVLEYVIDCQCAAMIRAVAADDRREIAKEVRIKQIEWSLPANATGGVRAVRQFRGVMDFALPGGRKLFDATMADAAEAERFYRATQRTYRTRADFFAKLLERQTAAKQLVRDAWTTEELEATFLATGNG